MRRRATSIPCRRASFADRLLSNTANGRRGSSCDLREGPTTAAIAELDQQTLCLALHAVPRAGAPLTGGHPTSRVALSRRTPYSAEGRVTSRLRQYLGSALAAEPQARDIMHRCHASSRAPLGIQSVLASIRGRLWQARRPWTRLRSF
jgi:hypothetical protein